MVVVEVASVVAAGVLAACWQADRLRAARAAAEARAMIFMDDIVRFSSVTFNNTGPSRQFPRP